MRQRAEETPKNKGDDVGATGRTNDALCELQKTSTTAFPDESFCVAAMSVNLLEEVITMDS